LDTLRFRAPIKGLIGSTCTIRLRFIGKRVVHFLLLLTELISRCYTAEPLRAKIDWKSA